MQQQVFSTGFELKFLAETGLFEGYASVFNVTDSVNDKIVPGAFRASLVAFRQEGKLPALLWQHDTAEPIGAIREMYEDDHGLFIKGELFIADLARAREAFKLLKTNVVNGLSIGYRVKNAHRDKKSGIRILTEVDLIEVSLVTFPANTHARVIRFSGGGSATGHIPTERALEEILRTAGLSRRQAKGVMAIGYKALKSENNPLITLADRLQEAAEETKIKAAEALTQRLRAATAEIEKKFDPNQPRIPTVDEQALGHPLSPLDLIGGGIIARVGRPLLARALQRVRGLHRPDSNTPRSSVFRAPREREYLDRVRQLPRSVRETGKGESTLTAEQKTSLKRFKKKNPKVQQEIEVTKLSDGSAIFTARKPAYNIRRSYRIYEKRVDSNGTTIKTDGTTIGPDGEFVHTKPK